MGTVLTVGGGIALGLASDAIISTDDVGGQLAVFARVFDWGAARRDREIRLLL